MMRGMVTIERRANVLRHVFKMTEKRSVRSIIFVRDKLMSASVMTIIGMKEKILINH